MFNSATDYSQGLICTRGVATKPVLSHIKLKFSWLLTSIVIVRSSQTDRSQIDGRSGHFKAVKYIHRYSQFYIQLSFISLSLP